MEYHKKCNVCGKIYCYSDEDLKKNLSNSTVAAISAIGGIASIFGGTRLDTYALNNQTDRYSSKVVDYNKCPFCNSTDVTQVNSDEWKDIQKNERNMARKAEINVNATEETLLKRASMFIADEEWDVAEAYCEQVLDINPECAQAYVYKLMIELNVTQQENLSNLVELLTDNKNYQKALCFADSDYKEILQKYNLSICENIYSNARDFIVAENSTEEDINVARLNLTELGNYKDSKELIKQCDERLYFLQYKRISQQVNEVSTKEEFQDIKTSLVEFGDYLDARALVLQCEDEIAKIDAEEKHRLKVGWIKVITVIFGLFLVVFVFSFIVLHIGSAPEDDTVQVNEVSVAGNEIMQREYSFVEVGDTVFKAFAVYSQASDEILKFEPSSGEDYNDAIFKNVVAYAREIRGIITEAQKMCESNPELSELKSRLDILANGLPDYSEEDVNPKMYAKFAEEMSAFGYDMADFADYMADEMEKQ